MKTIGDMWRDSDNGQLTELTVDLIVTFLCRLYDVSEEELVSKYFNEEAYYYRVKEYFDTDISKLLEEAEHVS